MIPSLKSGMLTQHFKRRKVFEKSCNNNVTLIKAFSSSADRRGTDDNTKRKQND